MIHGFSTKDAERINKTVQRSEKTALGENSHRRNHKGGAGGDTYNGSFLVEQKNDTTVTIKAYDGADQLGRNRITAGLESLISAADVDVTITTSGPVYAQVTYSGGLVVAYLNAASLPAQSNGNVYITIAEVLFVDSAITKITQIQRNEIHVAGRFI